VGWVKRHGRRVRVLAMVCCNPVVLIPFFFLSSLEFSFMLWVGEMGDISIPSGYE
jgi:hypothetical protein